MNVVIETERLSLRQFTEDDASLIYELNSEPDVMKYTHIVLQNIDQAKEMLGRSTFTQYALYNYSRWAVHIRQTLEFIGVVWFKLPRRI